MTLSSGKEMQNIENSDTFLSTLITRLHINDYKGHFMASGGFWITC